MEIKGISAIKCAECYEGEEEFICLITLMSGTLIRIDKRLCIDVLSMDSVYIESIER